jgi:type III secretory pathway component EscU
MVKKINTKNNAKNSFSFRSLFLPYSQLLVVFVAIAVPLASLLSGQSLWRLVLQVSIAVLIIGFLVWLFNRMVFQGMLDATIDKLKEQAEKEMEEAAEAARLAAEEAARQAEEAARLAAQAQAELEEEEEENSDILESELQL